MRSPAKHAIVLHDGSTVDDHEISDGSVGVHHGVAHDNRAIADLRRSGNDRAWMDEARKGEADCLQALCDATAQTIVPDRDRCHARAARKELRRQAIATRYFHAVANLTDGSGIERRDGLETGRPSDVDDNFGMPASTNYQEIHSLSIISYYG